MTTTMSRSIPTPRKRTSFLPITMLALTNSKIALGSAIFYAMFIAILVGFLYPTMSALNLNAYFTSNILTGLLGAKVQRISGFTALMGIELYSAFYGLIFGGFIAYIAGSALPTTIENGTLDLALSRPVSRTRYYLEMWLSAILGAIIVSVATVLAVWLGSLSVKDANIDWQWLIITQLIEFTLLFCTTGIGVMLGSFMNAGRAAGGAAVGVLALAYIMNTIGGISDKLDWMLKLQPFYYASGIQALIEHDFTRWHPWVLVGVGLVCGIVGLVVFNRRDLPTT